MHLIFSDRLAELVKKAIRVSNFYFFSQSMDIFMALDDRLLMKIKTDSATGIQVLTDAVGWARSKCALLFDGQKFVAVTMMDPGRHHFWSLKHLISKQAPHARPFLKRASQVENASTVSTDSVLIGFALSSVKRFSPEDSVDLKYPFTSKEIRNAIGACGSEKTSGHDGFTFKFLKNTG
ncbi:hypothetical protein LXL04_032914 [Taraxacum kok-saghyz]